MSSATAVVSRGKRRRSQKQSARSAVGALGAAMFGNCFGRCGCRSHRGSFAVPPSPEAKPRASGLALPIGWFNDSPRHSHCCGAGATLRPLPRERLRRRERGRSRAHGPGMPTWPGLLRSSPSARYRGGGDGDGGFEGGGGGGGGGGRRHFRGDGRRLRRRRRRWRWTVTSSFCYELSDASGSRKVLGDPEMTTSMYPWRESVDRQAFRDAWKKTSNSFSHWRSRSRASSFGQASRRQTRSQSTRSYSQSQTLPKSLLLPQSQRQSQSLRIQRRASFPQFQREAILRRGLSEKLYQQQGALKVLFVFARDDGTLTALRGAAGQLGYECSLARTLVSGVDAFQSRCHDLVIVDNRDPKTLDGEAIGKALRGVKGSQYSVFVALVKRSEAEKQDCSIIPYINAGYDRWVVEMTTVPPFVSELLQMDTSEVQPRKQLWAYQSFVLMAERSRELCIITDIAHHIVYVNRAVERAVGSSSKELNGRCVYDLVHVDSKERLLNAAVKGREWEGVATVAPRRNSETLMLQCRVMPNGHSGRAPANLVFLLEPPPKRGSEAGISGRGSVPSVRRGSADMRSVCSDGRSIWAVCKSCLCCRVSPGQRKGRRRGSVSTMDGRRSGSSVDTGDSLRRQSVTKLNALSIEAPITKVITLISQAQEMSSPEVSLMLDKVVDILRNTELYSPVVREDKLRPDDPVTSDLISALLQAGSSMPMPTTRRSSNDSAVTRGVHTARGSRSVPNVTTQLSTLLETSLMWEFDIFKLEELSGQRPLVHLGMNLMEHFDVPQTLNVDPNTMQNWLSIIEMNYRATNTYHNSSHAADVMQSTAAFMERERLQRILDPLDCACCLIAAAVHDVDHPGRSSAFLCNSDHDLAILYNDICVLESHHAALAFRLTVSDERVNILKGLDRDMYKTVRLSIIDMVLATEMTKHFEHLAKFVNVFSKPVREDDESTHNRSRRSLLQLGVETEGAIMTPENIALAKRMLIKCADVSNPARPLRMCVEWALRIAEEYFQQTDEEKDKQLPVVMPMFDRASCSIPKSQLGFMDFIINDMFEAWEAFLNMPEINFYMECNYSYWRNLEGENELSVDVERMRHMIEVVGWFGSYKPLPMTENSLPFMTDLANRNLLSKSYVFHLNRISDSKVPPQHILEIFENFPQNHKITLPTKSGIDNKNGPTFQIESNKPESENILSQNGNGKRLSMQSLEESETDHDKEIVKKSGKAVNKYKVVKIEPKSSLKNSKIIIKKKSIKFSEEKTPKTEGIENIKAAAGKIDSSGVKSKLDMKVSRSRGRKQSTSELAKLDGKQNDRLTENSSAERNEKHSGKRTGKLTDKLDAKQSLKFTTEDAGKQVRKHSSKGDKMDARINGKFNEDTFGKQERGKNTRMYNENLDLKHDGKHNEKLDDKLEVKIPSKRDFKLENTLNSNTDTKLKSKTDVNLSSKPEDNVDMKPTSQHGRKRSAKHNEKLDDKLEVKVPSKRDFKLGNTLNSNTDTKLESKTDANLSSKPEDNVDMKPTSRHGRKFSPEQSEKNGEKGREVKINKPSNKNIGKQGEVQGAKLINECRSSCGKFSEELEEKPSGKRSGKRNSEKIKIRNCRKFGLCRKKPQLITLYRRKYAPAIHAKALQSIGSLKGVNAYKGNKDSKEETNVDNEH